MYLHFLVISIVLKHIPGLPYTLFQNVRHAEKKGGEGEGGEGREGRGGTSVSICVKFKISGRLGQHKLKQFLERFSGTLVTSGVSTDDVKRAMQCGI